MPRPIWQLALAWTTLFALSVGVGAQTVHGRIVDAAGHPVYGVVVILVDSTSQVVARSLSSQSGDYRLSAPHAGTYRFRTLRIGFQPVVSDVFTLAAGADVARPIALASLPIGLDTVRVAGENVCRSFTDSGAATHAVWEQIRTALIAAELTAASRNVLATTVTYDRAMAPSGGRNARIIDQSSRVSTEYVTRAWRTLPPDRLRSVGYVVTGRDASVTYYAPGIETLLSPIFVSDHCFRLVTDRKRKEFLGIAFEPTPERKKGVAEVRGTMWIDRASSELRDLEFRYVNVSREQEDRAGGNVSFARMRDGTWAVSRWEIRMPVIDQVILPGQGPQPRVVQLQTTGGRLALARRGTDTLWSGPRFPLRGTAVDSASGSPVRGAHIVLAGTALDATTDERGRFTIDRVFPGNYTLDVHTASLDSMNAAHRVQLTLVDSTTTLELQVPTGAALAAAICGRNPETGGIIVGTLRLRDKPSRAALRGGKVVAEWSAAPRDAASSRTRRLEAPSAQDGSFRLCGVPIDAAVSLRATTDSADTAEPTTVHIPAGARITRTEVTLDREAVLALRGATFTGIVVADSTKLPIAGVEVSFPELKKSVLTDDLGAFRILGIPPGEQHLAVRRIGYGAADTRVTFTGHETLERRIVLGRAITLNPVVVTERENDRTMPGFEENRRVGLGRFLTRDDLAKYDGMKLATALQQMQGFGMVDGRGHQWPSSRYVTPPVCPDGPAYTDCMHSHGFYLPQNYELAQGMRTACYAQVYVDGVLMNGMREPTEPFDIAAFGPERVEAIEYYAGPSQTPLKYSRMGSACGVLVIWTRRSP